MLRRDPLTGTVSVEADQTGKPVPSVVRQLPPEQHPCAFCLVAAEAATGVAVVQGRERVHGRWGPPGYAVSIDNRWKLIDGPPAPRSAVPDPGRSAPAGGTVELLVTPEHVTSIEQLDTADRSAFASLLLERHGALTRTFGSAMAFVSVGVQAGSSLPHLHGQVAGFTWGAPAMPQSEGCAVCHDVDLAEEAGRIVASAADWVLYVPWAPSSSGELRCALRTGIDGSGDAALVGPLLAAGLADALRRWEAGGLHWPYQAVLRPGRHPYAHLLPRLDLGLIYPRFAGVMPVTFDHTAYARRLAGGGPSLES